MSRRSNKDVETLSMWFINTDRSSSSQSLCAKTTLLILSILAAHRASHVCKLRPLKSYQMLDVSPLPAFFCGLSNVSFFPVCQMARQNAILLITSAMLYVKLHG